MRYSVPFHLYKRLVFAVGRLPRDTLERATRRADTFHRGLAVLERIYARSQEARRS